MSKPAQTQWELSFSGSAAFIDLGAEWNQSKGIVWTLIDSQSVQGSELKVLRQHDRSRRRSRSKFQNTLNLLFPSTFCRISN